MADDIAIKVDHVSKTFKLPHEKQSSIKGALINKFRGGKKSFERQQVLDDVSFEIKKGEFFGIVGRNGSGKSTLLKMLAGIYVPTKGDIQVNGKLTPFIELGVGFNHELTGRENVFLNGALLGFNRSEMEEMYEDIVSFAEIEKFMDQKLKNYSSGMQVRLAFSIAIRAQTEILIMDEVLAVGDSAFQKKCFDIFRKLKNEGRTIILVTHDMGNVERFCDRVLVLHDSKAIDLTTPAKAAGIYSRLNIEENSENGADVSDATEVLDRWGVGGIKVKSVAFFDKNDKKTSIIQTGESLKVVIRLNRNEKHQQTPVVCGLAIYNQDGVNVAGPNSENTKIKNGANEVTAVIPALNFAPGEYQLTVAIFNTEVTEPYDFLDKREKFSIVTDHTVHGLIELDSSWSSN